MPQFSHLWNRRTVICYLQNRRRDQVRYLWRPFVSPKGPCVCPLVFSSLPLSEILQGPCTDGPCTISPSPSQCGAQSWHSGIVSFLLSKWRPKSKSSSIPSPSPLLLSPFFLPLYLPSSFFFPYPSPSQDSYSNGKYLPHSFQSIPHFALRSSFQRHNWDHMTTCSESFHALGREAPSFWAWH